MTLIKYVFGKRANGDRRACKSIYYNKLIKRGLITPSCYLNVLFSRKTAVVFRNTVSRSLAFDLRLWPSLRESVFSIVTTYTYDGTITVSGYRVGDIGTYSQHTAESKSIGELLPNFGAGRLILSRSSNDCASRHAITMGLSGGGERCHRFRSRSSPPRGCLTRVSTRFHLRVADTRGRLASETADNETVTARYFPERAVQYRATRTVFNSQRRI